MFFAYSLKGVRRRARVNEREIDKERAREREKEKERDYCHLLSYIRLPIATLYSCRQFFAAQNSAATRELYTGCT
jgi:hypothetical protein